MSSPHGPRVLLVTNLYPVQADPARGIFVARQMRAVSEVLRRPVEVVVVGKTGAGGLLRSRRAVAEAIKQAAPDVLHVYYGLSGAALPFRSRRPVVVTLCGSDVLRWRVWRDAKGFLEYVVSIATAQRARAVLVQSAAIRDALPSGRLRGRIEVLATGTDTKLFRPEDRSTCRRRLGWDLRQHVVLFGAAPERAIKRYELAVAACRLLADRFALPVSLRALGGVWPDTVPTYLNAADCLLVTSDWEAGPIVFTEALACGVPVVTVPVGYATQAGWPPEYVRVAARTPDALAAALADLLRNAPAHERPSDLALPTEAEYAARLVEVYERVA